MIKKLWVVGLLPLLAACTTMVPIDPTGEPAAQVTAGKKINAPVAISYQLAPGDLSKRIECGAAAYAFDAQEGVRHTLDLANEAMFTNIVADEGTAAYVVRIQADSLDGNMSLMPGFWSATVSANAEIVLRVSVTDKAHREIVRTSIDGHGGASGNGDCAMASPIVKDAVEKALRRVGDEYAYRVLNPLQLP